MPGLSTSLLGKQQKQFRLLTEETARKWRFPIGDVNTVTEQFESGQIVYFGSEGKVKAVPIASLHDSSESIIGVAMDTYIPTVNECAGAGLATVIVGEHFGQTKAYDTANTYTKGTRLYSSTSETGNFAASATTGPAIGYVVEERGDWLEYVWTGRQPQVA